MNKEEHILIYIRRLEEKIFCQDLLVGRLLSIVFHTSRVVKQCISEEQNKLEELKQQLAEAQRQYRKAKPFQN